MGENEFIKICEKNYSKKEIDNFKKAIDLAKRYLEEEKRLSRESQTEHNFEMATILADSKISSEIITASLLYGLENKILPSEVKEFFDSDIADLVFGQIQLKNIRAQTKCVEAEILRKILLTTLKDVRIIFVKLADKLANLRTIKFLPAIKQKEIAEEVLEIYAPLANRLGLEQIRRQLEDEAFKIINPRKYQEIETFLQESKQEREKFIENFIEHIKRNLHDIKILKIKGREKQIYSIYKKLNRTSLDSQKDHFAVRIIVKNVKDCYNILGRIHESYESVQETLKDYIANPKENGYQSIHTVIKTKEGKIIEVQIRTQEMDDSSEEGSAAHWRYKKLKSDLDFEKKTGWLKNILDQPNICKNPQLIQSIKINLFGGRIFCYTPKGKTVELPERATVLDFAYHIHQEIGDKSIGGRINGAFASLKKELKNGDVVEIITNKMQRPRRDWLKFIISGKARNKIKQGIKKYENLPAPKKIPMKGQKEEDFENIVDCEEFPHANLVLAKCCCPIPPERIIGVMKTQRIFSIHSKDCSEIKKIGAKLIPVCWKETFNTPLKIKVQAKDRSGILADILNTIIRGGFIVKEAKIRPAENANAECSFIIVPRKLSEIVKLIERIKKIRGIIKVYFG